MRDATLRMDRYVRKPFGGRAVKVGLALAFGAAFASLPTRARADDWRFDLVHSQVWFTASHQGFSHPQGRLRIAQGWFRFDPDDWRSAAVDVVLDVASADLGDEGWNKALRSGALLDAGRRPTARYASRSVERSGERSGVIHGELELRGRRVPVDVAFTLNRIGNDPYAFGRKAGFSASARLARADFGIDRYQDVIGATIELRFEIEGIADRDAGPQTTTREDHDGDQE
ncbi:MAG: polyisoprenoid-binding protein [Lysobacteraceae bacterium]|nr:MAG: polyisoprenoid-binding protein [Xanthomonadaceae bacterium]